ncbi:hypothetical protein [uncultured Dokdonia sp.]|uniref:hypothetical protein n=1 Tax=uncultured Dokdonia sp. TaxID=575653 RepID=UPI002624E1A7|nr:hypothetical protein [uncultured Dokdonia sp.]
MKSLKNLKSFEISTEKAKEVNGATCEHLEHFNNCVATALENENEFLIEVCAEVLC